MNEVGSRDRIAVIYDRASRQQQADNYSRADAARLSGLAEGMDLPWELRREIKSGESLTNRPVMKQLLEEVEAGMVAAIICQDFSRLSRDEDGIDGRIIRQICRDNECIIVTPERAYNFSMDLDDDLAGHWVFHSQGAEAPEHPLPCPRDDGESKARGDAPYQAIPGLPLGSD